MAFITRRPPASRGGLSGRREAKFRMRVIGCVGPEEVPPVPRGGGGGGAPSQGSGHGGVQQWQDCGVGFLTPQPQLCFGGAKWAVLCKNVISIECIHAKGVPQIRGITTQLPKGGAKGITEKTAEFGSP